MRYLLFIPILFIFHPIVCQTYIPFPVDSGQWMNSKTEYIFSYPGYVYSTEKYCLDGTQTIEGLVYSRLKYSNFNSSVIFTNNADGGFIREYDKKVYYKYNETAEERMIYNFNISAGDTFKIYSLWYSDSVNLIVDSVTNEFNYGMDRNTYYIRSDLYGIYFYVIWYEGIGSSKGLINEPVELIDGPSIYLTDFYSDSSNCTIYLSTHNPEWTDISVYPNPANNWIFITSLSSSLSDFSISTMENKVMMAGKIHSNRIDINCLPPGIYMLNVYSDHRRFMAKLIKL
ncbi:MAG: T9SS type A sorting domain-containing protein [Chitinophagales bacterium]|nr:T9SS type A sorting domain-containing protein [Chitinophagales bacterium]